MAAMMKVQTDREFRSLLDAISQYRLEQNLTYRQLAEQVGVGYSRLFAVLNDAGVHLNDRTRYRIESFGKRVGLVVDKVAS